MTGDNDSVPEHSWGVGFVALYLIEKFSISCNKEKILKYALIHDIVELYSDDIDCVNSLKSKDFWQQKTLIEQNIMETKFANNKDMTWVYETWIEYENGCDFESQLVRVVDKLEAYLHLLNVNEGNYKLEKLHLDFCSYAMGQLTDNNSKEILVKIIEEVKKELIEKYSKLKLA